MEQHDQEPVKDIDEEHPIAVAWRHTLQEIVHALVEGDYGLSRGIASVAPVDEATAEQIRGYVSQYGETLIELPDETWSTSVAQWMGTHWDALVDLWTRQSGRSDMILAFSAFETREGFRFEIDSVHVP